MMSKSKYCVFYPDEEGVIVVQENLTVDDLSALYKDLNTHSKTEDIFVFNMKGLADSDDAVKDPSSYSVVYISDGELYAVAYESANLEEISKQADKIYIIDDVYIINDLALKQLL